MISTIRPLSCAAILVGVLTAAGPAPRASAFATCLAPCSGPSFAAKLIAIMAHHR